VEALERTQASDVLVSSTVSEVRATLARAHAVSSPSFALHARLLTLETALGGLSLGLTVLVALGFAGVTVYEAAYAPKTSFAGFPDYFTLFSAALASGVAATVLGLLAYWRPAPEAP
jgi:hypothetical protein